MPPYGSFAAVGKSSRDEAIVGKIQVVQVETGTTIILAVWGSRVRLQRGSRIRRYGEHEEPGLEWGRADSAPRRLSPSRAGQSSNGTQKSGYGSKLVPPLTLGPGAH